MPSARTLLPLALLTLGSPLALAQPSALDRQAAQSLFDSARRLMKEGRHAEACPQFEQSQKLDPGGGTLLNLAVCHEKLGRLATAHAEYNEALSLARAAGRADREKTASDAIAALAPRLPRLRVVVQKPPPDLALALDGQAIPPAIWNVPTPFDPGKHALTATAPGRSPFSVGVTLREAETTDLELPELPLATPSATPPPLATAPPPTTTPAPATAPLPPLFSLCEGVTLPDGTCASKPRSNLVEREVNPPLKTAMLGLSITATTAALIFGGVAYGLQKGAHCDATSRRCDDQASLDRAHTARTMAWVSTFSTGAAVASGVAYFLLPTRKVHIDFGAAPSGATVALGGWLP